MIYLDYASTTPVDPRVLKAMLPYFGRKYGNSMSLHSVGQEAKLALEESRKTIADKIGADSSEIIFTSSATESNNLALKGIAFAHLSKKRLALRSLGEGGGSIVISSIEHPCIMESAEFLKSLGFEILKVKTDKFGTVDLDDLKKLIKEDTILVSIIHASNEIGTIQPIKEIYNICKEKGALFHTDAVQSFGKIPVKAVDADMITLSSHKIYGPKGIACLYIKKGIQIEPLISGGGQESGLRGSTVNVAGAVGFAKAVEILDKKECLRIEKLRDKLIKGVLKIPNSHLNGHPKDRICNNANFRFDFIEGESLLVQLDLEGFEVSTGSACSSLKLEPSHVLLALGISPKDAHGSLRITLGRQTKEEDINKLLKVLPKIVEDLRKISPFHEK